MNGKAVGAYLRAAFDRLVNEPLDAAMGAALSKLGADLLPSGVRGGFPDAGDTDDPLVVLERRVAATREG